MNPKRDELNKNFHRHKAERKNYPLTCKRCGSIYELALTEREYYSGRYRKFCSDKCSTYKDKTHNGRCLFCGATLSHKRKLFCDQTCHMRYVDKQFIDNWKNGMESGTCGGMGFVTSKRIRNYLFKKYNGLCCQCGWHEINPKTGKVPLQIEHIDGNYKNNNEDNLKLLCPNCHSLTETYGSLNKGNGRRYRNKFAGLV